MRIWNRRAGLKLMASGALEGALNGAWGAAKPGILRSTDRGRTWTNVNVGFGARVNAFAWRGNSVYAGTDAGIYASQDQGRSWRQVATGRALSMARLGRYLHAGMDGGGLLSSVDGESWFPNLAFPANRVRSLLSDAGNLYAGTDHQGVLVSRNEGRAWATVSDGLPERAQIFAMASLRGHVFAALYAKGLHAWQGRRWVKVGDVVPLVLAGSGETLVAGLNPGGILCSGDLGSTWTPADVIGKAPVWAAGAGAALLLAGAGQGIYRSDDLGRSWTQTPASSPGIAFLVRDDFALAATA